MKNVINQVISTLLGITSILFVVVLLLFGGTLFLREHPEWRFPEWLSNTEQELTSQSSDESLVNIVDGKDEKTGLLDGQGIELVVLNCTRCHSAKLVTQNRATREGWLAMIRWMQKTQNLNDLGENEEAILNYLAKYYAPEDVGRRKNLADIKWYRLED